MRIGSLLFAAALAAGSFALPAPGAVRAGKAAPKRTGAAPRPAVPPQVQLLGSLTVQVPGEWKSVPPGGAFRAAQYELPRAKGDSAAASFIIYHFGKGQGGTVEANVERWIGMLQQPGGKDPHAVAHRGRIDREGLRISTLDTTGTYLERPFPSSDQVTPRPNSRMLAAIVETTRPDGDGPYFFRIVGPARSVAAAKPGWDATLASVKPK